MTNDVNVASHVVSKGPWPAGDAPSGVEIRYRYNLMSTSGNEHYSIMAYAVVRKTDKCDFVWGGERERKILRCAEKQWAYTTLKRARSSFLWRMCGRLEHLERQRQATASALRQVEPDSDALIPYTASRGRWEKCDIWTEM